MADLKKQLAEGGLPKEVQNTILEAWDSQLAEAREEIAADLREELAVKYERDREQTVTAINEMINDVVAEEVENLNEERKALAADRIKMKESIRKFSEFALRKLGSEIVELNEDRKGLEKNMGLFKEFFLRQTDRELTEFRTETRALANARVKVLSEGRKKIEEAKAEFIKRASAQAARWISETTKREFTEFRSEINEARQVRFGQKLFEAMAEEFRAYHYNEDAHLRQLHEAIAEREEKLEEARASLKEKEVKVLEAQKATKIARDRVIRESKINSALGHLSREKRDVMLELLEDVQTEKLDESIKKYLPMVLKENKVSTIRNRKMLSESEKKSARKVVTGDRTENIITENRSNDVVELDDEINRIVHLGTHR
jgi:hypothetical protein